MCFFPSIPAQIKQKNVIHSGFRTYLKKHHPSGGVNQPLLNMLIQGGKKNIFDSLLGEEYLKEYIVILI